VQIFAEKNSRKQLQFSVYSLKIVLDE